MTNVFSVVALAIMFREALEAAIIISVMLQLCDRLNLRQMKKTVWIGALLGCGIALIIGIIFIIIFYVAQNAVFSGDGKVIFEGFLELLASWLITILGFAMLKINGYETKWESKLQRQAAAQAAAKTDPTVNTKKGKWGIFVLAFTTTLREGLEAVIFIAGVSAGLPVSSIPIPAVVGIIMGITVGVILYWSGKKLSDISWFMYGMTIFLFFIAAGLVGRAIVAFQSVGWFGYNNFPESARPWQNHILYDWSARCPINIQDNWACGILSAIVGYQSQGTAIWLFAYFGYWLEIFFVIAIKAFTGTLTSAGVPKKQLKLPAKDKAARSSESSEDSTIKADAPVPKGKEVTSGDFIVGPNMGGPPKSKFAHNSDSGSSSSETPAVHQVQLSDMQPRH